MGFFLELKPSAKDVDINKKYCIPDRAKFIRTQCQHINVSGEECSNYTVLRTDIDGKRYCYFHHNDSASIIGKDLDFDNIQKKICTIETRHEEECSIYYYNDIFNYIKEHHQEINTLVEVGCYLGGLSVILALAAKEFNMRLYIVEFNLMYLSYTYERIERVAPGCLEHVHIYHGVFDDFCNDYRAALRERSVFLEIDACHTYEGVYNDLKASYEINQGIHSISLHDFHLRSKALEHDLFIDRAIFSIFGASCKYLEIGFNTQDWKENTEYDYSNNLLYNKHYCSEGVILNMAENAYCFDALARKAKLDKIISHSWKHFQWWVENKRRSKTMSILMPPIYNVNKKTGIRIYFPISANESNVKEIKMRVGEYISFLTLGRLFQKYDNGDLYRELPFEELNKVSVKCNDNFLKLQGFDVNALSAGKTEIHFDYDGQPWTVSVLIEESIQGEMY